MKTIQTLQNELRRLDANGYLTLTDEQLEDRSVLEQAIRIIKAESIKTKRANELNPNDKLVRFGHVLKIKTITRRIHPLAGVETVCVEHEAGTVDFMSNGLVEVES